MMQPTASSTSPLKDLISTVTAQMAQSHQQQQLKMQDLKAQRLKRLLALKNVMISKSQRHILLNPLDVPKNTNNINPNGI